MTGKQKIACIWIFYLVCTELTKFGLAYIWLWQASSGLGCHWAKSHDTKPQSMATSTLCCSNTKKHQKFLFILDGSWWMPHLDKGNFSVSARLKKINYKTLCHKRSSFICYFWNYSHVMIFLYVDSWWKDYLSEDIFELNKIKIKSDVCKRKVTLLHMSGWLL